METVCRPAAGWDRLGMGRQGRELVNGLGQVLGLGHYGRGLRNWLGLEVNKHRLTRFPSHMGIGNRLSKIGCSDAEIN